MDELISITPVKFFQIIQVTHGQDIEELIADLMTDLMIRSERLN